jgi:hypothetical protein
MNLVLKWWHWTLQECQMIEDIIEAPLYIVISLYITYIWSFIVIIILPLYEVTPSLIDCYLSSN